MRKSWHCNFGGLETLDADTCGLGNGAITPGPKLAPHGVLRGLV